MQKGKSNGKQDASGKPGGIISTYVLQVGPNHIIKEVVWGDMVFTIGTKNKRNYFPTSFLSKHWRKNGNTNTGPFARQDLKDWWQDLCKRLAGLSWGYRPVTPPRTSRSLASASLSLRIKAVVKIGIHMRPQRTHIRAR